MRRYFVVASLFLAVAVKAADIPVRYTVNDTTLKAAVSGTPLTFELFTDSACTLPAVHSATVAVEQVSVISRLKVFKPRGASTSRPKTAELSTTLNGVSATGNLYLKVTGVGVAAVGTACQVQAVAPSASPMLVDAQDKVLGPLVSYSETTARRAAGGVYFLTFNYGRWTDVRTYYVAADCSGTALFEANNESTVSSSGIYSRVAIRNGAILESDNTQPQNISPSACRGHDTCGNPGATALPDGTCCQTPCGGSGTYYATGTSQPFTATLPLRVEYR